VTWTEGQRLALEQLREIERNSGAAIMLRTVADSPTPSGYLRVELSIICRGLPRVASGLALRDRERLVVLIPPDFPFKVPSLRVEHDRFAGKPHVQWVHHLCLYISTETEWQPNDGMFGFVGRVWEWLTQGATDQLDPEGAPLHPPVAYQSAQSDLVIPRANTPQVADQPWIGLAAIRPVGAQRVDIVGWSDLLSPPASERVGVACLLASPFPFEYPGRVSDLMAQLSQTGVDQGRLLLCLEWAALHNPDGTPLHIVIGTPMRGVRGATVLSQHLAVWRLEPVVADALRLATRRLSDNPDFQRIGEGMREAVLSWASEASVTWSRVREARDEVTIRRDAGSAMSVFAGKTIAIWGVGALGGHIAEMLLRAGVQKFLLHDQGFVAPGLLARQPFDDADLGRHKVDAIADRLRRIDPNVEIQAFANDVLDSPLGTDDWTGGADVVFDTTASIQVLAKSEARRASRPKDSKTPIVSMVIDHTALRGMLSVVGSQFTGGSADAIRKAKIELARRVSLKEFLDSFWPVGSQRPVFQPEPGCSANTFIGSAADLQGLAAVMVNEAARTLAGDVGQEAMVQFVKPIPESAVVRTTGTKFAFEPDAVSFDPQSGYEIRIAASAWAEILAWISRARRTLGKRVETGGVLFGQRDPVARVVWVSDVIGPPPDSTSSAEGFVCGVQGVAEANEEKTARTRGSVSFVGMWHTHPGGLPIPSATDLNGMAQIVAATDSRIQQSLLLIVGGATPFSSSIGTFLFERSEFDKKPDELFTRRCEIRRGPPKKKPQRNVGLALSGGGSRAIAFHLGCLRALHDRGILDRVSTLSTVSGGSVIGAMYAYSADSFEDFEKRVQKLLRSGLVRTILRKAISPRQLTEALFTTATAGVASAGSSLIRSAARALSLLGLGIDQKGMSQAPLRRRRSRTDAFEAALRSMLFGNLRVSDVRRAGLDVVINTTELCTGTAFRFSNRGSGASRFGSLTGLDPDVSLAVAASAAYPALLPALDREFTFTRRDGTTRKARVLLADGGIYDNLGSMCMEPGRSEGVSQHVFDPDYLIVCDAGVGTVSGSEVPYWWPKRMSVAMETMFRRVQNSTRDRLHQHVEYGKLSGFILSYLGLQDGRLPWRPVDLVPRATVVDYPTDFSPMSANNVRLLSSRGEQLTRLLIDYYLPEL
jgi:integrative and conjugative element protein (TIGR02256 family)